MRSEKLLKSMSLTILTVITLSIIIPATTTLALSTSKYPIATIKVIKTSRDDFGRKVWYNQIFYVDVWLDSKPGDNITLSVTVHETTYAINASYISGTAYQFRAWFNITKEGKLYYNSTAGTSVPTDWEPAGAPVEELKEGDTIEIAYGTLTPATLTFEHTPADLSIRSKAPYPLNLTVTNDWSIVAPDLNKNPLEKENFTAYIEIMDYTQGWEEPKKVLIPFKETDVNSGEFAPTSLSILNDTKKADYTTSTDTTLKVLYEGSEEFTTYPIYNGSILNVTYEITILNSTSIDTKGTTNGNHTFDLEVNGTISLNAGTYSVVSYGFDVILINETFDNNTVTSVTIPVFDGETGYDVGSILTYINITKTSSGTYYMNVTNITISLYTDYIFRLGKVKGEAPGDYMTVKVIVPQFIGATTDPDKDTEVPEIFTAIGTIEVPIATLREFNITIIDPDENRDSLSKDTVTIYLEFPNGSVIKDTLSETGKDTGVFSKEYTTYDWVEDGYLNNTHNKIVIYATTYYYSAATGVLAIGNVTKKVSVPYTTASIEVTPTEVLIPATASPVETIVITIKDSDLNLLSTVDAWKLTLESGQNLSNVELKHTVLTELPAFANLTIEAVYGDTSVPLRTSVPITITFVETGDDTGEFKASISLRNFDWNRIRNALGGKTPEKLVITYTDIFNADLKKGVNVTAEVTVAKATLTVDRDVIPLSKHGDMVLHITVKDPASKGAGTVNLNVTAYNYEGKKVWSDPVNAAETGIETGEFEADYTITTNKVKPELIGGKLVIAYGDIEKEVPFEVYGVEMYVNGSSSVTVKYGDVINVTIVDPDRNLDNSEVDEFTLEVLEFKETGPDTGVFVATYTVDFDFGEAGKPVKIEYKDSTPTYATPAMTEWPSPDTFAVTVNIQSFTGTLLVNGEEEYLEVGPIGKLNITVVDWDMNKNPDDIDNVTIYIKLWNGTYLSEFTAEETGESTGVFTLSIDIKDEIGTPGEIIGKNIQVMYKDEKDAAGEVTTKIVTLKFISWDPEISTDKTAYNIGEKIKITVKDMDANTDPDRRESVTVRVYSTSDPIGTSIPLRETGKDTGVFIGEVLVSDTMMSGAVYAKLGDIVTIEYTDKYPADYGVTEESKTFSYTVRVGIPVEKPIVPSAARFVDPLTGAEITPKVGKTVGIGITLSNEGYLKQTFTAILVIRDAEGVAVGIQWQTVTLPAGESGEVGFTFTPTVAGDYTVEVYIIKSLADWTPLGEMLTTTMTVTE